MVRKKIHHHSEMRTEYLLKPEQTLENSKPSERLRALVVSKSTFQRFVDYTTETERIMMQKEKEAEKIEAMKKATYEKSKMWESKIENIKAKRRKELLSKRRKAEEERKMFVEEITEKKAAERADVVKQARRLLLQKKPLCRRINRALLASECLRELDAQVTFQKIIRTIDREQDTEYANSIKADVAKHEEEKRQETEERAKKSTDYKMQLKKQIEQNECEDKMRKAEELESEKQDQRNMSRDMILMKENEMQNLLNKKKKLQQFFKEAMDEKKRFELKLKQDEEFEDRALEVYRKAKDRIQKVHKSSTLREKKERIRQMQFVEEQYDTIVQIREAQEQEISRKISEEKKAIEAAEIEKQKACKERKETMRALIEEYRLQDTAVKEEQKQREKDLKTWEMMQRFKKDEYDKQVMLKEREQQCNQKLKYRNELQKKIEEKQNEKKYTKEILEAEATDLKASIEKANRRILLYGDEVLNESRDVRPLYPILKAIEECKSEMGLAPTKEVEEAARTGHSKRKHDVRRICTKPVPVDHIYYLQ